MTTPLSCPYCNAQLGAGDVTCPVCGERLPSQSGAITATSPAPVPAPTPETYPSRLPNRQVAFLVVLGMFVCALVGLGFALWSQGQRRANDAGLPPRPPRSPFDPVPGVVAPAELLALRYLPADRDLLVGIHFATLFDDPVVKPLLEQPLPVGKSRIRLTEVPTWVGLSPATLDHVVLGLTIPHGVPVPRVVLVVRTRTAYDHEQVKRTLQARKPTNAEVTERKELWEVRLGEIDFPATLWFADDHTLVLGLTSADFTDLPAGNTDKLGHLPETTRRLLRQRVDPGAALWAVGQLPEGLHGLAGLAAGGVTKQMHLTPDQREAVEGIQAFAGSVVPGKEIICRLDVATEKATAAEKIATLLRGSRPNPKIETDGAWVLVQWKTTLDDLKHGLER
jgi:hypothetical protein